MAKETMAARMKLLDRALDNAESKRYETQQAETLAWVQANTSKEIVKLQKQLKKLEAKAEVIQTKLVALGCSNYGYDFRVPREVENDISDRLSAELNSLRDAAYVALSNGDTEAFGKVFQEIIDYPDR